ncbi:tail fiber assembly protein [Providencia sp. PROV033]|uniref:tail fiber assembly protein n=1 Tax=Providencia sp. PROV033 TaxID=2949765 RepID=UPI00234A73C0|nr:tail fiber assembly protein [Providencia sp. PROV033]
MKYTTDIQYAEFKNGLTVKAGWAIIYRYHPATREFLGADFDNVPFGGSVVGDSCLDKPELPVKSDIAIIRSADEKSWLYVTDHQGKTAYSTETRQPLEVDFIGDLPEALTLLEPQTEFDKWDGKKWVTDTEAQKEAFIAQAESEKAQRLEEAEQHIAMLERKVRLNMATDEEKALLTAWEIYSVKVADVDTSLAPDIEYPQKP